LMSNLIECAAELLDLHLSIEVKGAVRVRWIVEQAIVCHLLSFDLAAAPAFATSLIGTIRRQPGS